MDSKEYQRLLKNEEMKRQEAATLAEQEVRFNRAKEIRKQINLFKRFFNEYLKDGCQKYDTISSIKIEAKVESHYAPGGELDKYEHNEPIIIDNVPHELAEKFIETYIDILNEDFKRI